MSLSIFPCNGDAATVSLPLISVDQLTEKIPLAYEILTKSLFRTRVAPPAYLGSVFAPPVFSTVKIVPMTYGATTSGISRRRVVPRAYEHPISRDFAPHTYESRAVLPHNTWFRFLRLHIPAYLLTVMCPNTRLLELVRQPVAHDFSRERAMFPKHNFSRESVLFPKHSRRSYRDASQN